MVHNIDPVIGQAAGFYLWWYGLGYTIGFLHLYFFLLRRRTVVGLTQRDVYTLTLLIAIGVLVGGRGVQVAFDEWPFYRLNPQLIPAFWLGGMASHGVMAGAALGAALFSVWKRKPFLLLADQLVVPGAFLMGMGRIGNFIDGQIVGSLTEVPWGVKFPYADGFRHPVVLYDGLKNLVLVPFLQRSSRLDKTPGATAARFVFWYSFLRILIDFFRDYPTHRLAIGTGQTLNILMVLLGIFMFWRVRQRRRSGVRHEASHVTADGPPLLAQRLGLAAILAFSLTLPSNWIQDIPARYGSRHPGLEYSSLYPQLDYTPPTGAAR